MDFAMWRNLLQITDFYGKIIQIVTERTSFMMYCYPDFQSSIQITLS